MEILWPEENSTWTNAAVIIAAHALSYYDLDFNKPSVNVFLELKIFLSLRLHSLAAILDIDKFFN